MERALHPDLSKKGVQVMEQTGKTVFSITTASNMVEYTRAGVGKNLGKKKYIQIVIFDVHKSTASTKIVSSDYVDYIHLVKANGKWKIINVLWERNN